MTKKKIYEYDFLRVYVLFLVIIGHSTYICFETKYGGINYQLYDAQLPYISVLLNHIIEMIYYFHMPLFMAISGALSHSSLNKDFNTLIKNKFLRLVVPYVFVSLFYAIPIKLLSGYFSGFTPIEILKSVIVGQLFLQGNSHLWFILTLFFIFLIIHFLINRINKIIVFIGLLILYFCSGHCEILLIKYIMENLIWFYVGYLFYYVREDYNYFVNDNKLISIIIPCVFFMLFKKYNFYLQYTLFESVHAFKLCVAFLGIMSSYNIVLLISKKIDLRNSKVFCMILEHSYGIYLYSDPLNYIILYAFSMIFGNIIYYSNFGYMFTFVFRLVVTTFGGLLMSIFIKKVMRKNG